MTSPPLVIAERVYCPRCQTRRNRDEFRTVMAYVPAGFTRKAPPLTLLKHEPCKLLVYVPATVHVR